MIEKRVTGHFHNKYLDGNLIYNLPSINTLKTPLFYHGHLLKFMFKEYKIGPPKTTTVVT